MKDIASKIIADLTTLPPKTTPEEWQDALVIVATEAELRQVLERHVAEYAVQEQGRE